MLRSYGESGSIQVVGNNITLTDDSLFLTFIQGNNQFNSINILAKDNLNLIGTTENSVLFPQIEPRYSRGIRNVSVGDGYSATITIHAKNLNLSGFGAIFTTNYNDSYGGDIILDIQERIHLSGDNPFDPFLPASTFITSRSSSSKPGGNISIKADSLLMTRGSAISSTTAEQGKGGDLILEVNSIALDGFNPISFLQTNLSTSSQGLGQGGNVQVESDRIALTNGGRIDSATFAFGNAGNITIKAHSIEVDGMIPDVPNPSLISSSANILSPLTRQLLDLPDIPSGDTGNLTIFSDRIRISNGALISASHDGTGNAGTIKISADFIELNNGGIVAKTFVGDGGIISLKTSQDIILRGNSTISATAGGNGNGGNININTRFLILDDSSSITAQAFEGKGGNIDLTVEGLLESPYSLISASSQLGVDGRISIDRNYKFEEALLI
ncbi:MAG: hypothetical protein RLZZ148_3045, partial [Cyanobacteriota bacterium]